jgi:hypothetical protein
MQEEEEVQRSPRRSRLYRLEGVDLVVGIYEGVIDLLQGARSEREEDGRANLGLESVTSRLMLHHHGREFLLYKLRTTDHTSPPPRPVQLISIRGKERKDGRWDSDLAMPSLSAVIHRQKFLKYPAGNPGRPILPSSIVRARQRPTKERKLVRSDSDLALVPMGRSPPRQMFLPYLFYDTDTPDPGSRPLCHRQPSAKESNLVLVVILTASYQPSAHPRQQFV